MRIGRFNNLVVIRRRSPGQGPIGQPLNTWVDFSTVWADVRHLTGIETVKADALASTAKASIRIRYLEGVTAGMRVVVDGREYNILAVLPDVGRRQFVDLACEVTS